MSRQSKVDTLLTMLKIEPEDIFLNYSLGLEYVADNNFDLAEQSFKKTISIQPNYIPAFYQLGKLYEAQQKNEKALNLFKQGLQFSIEQKNTKAINEFNEALFMLED